MFRILSLILLIIILIFIIGGFISPQEIVTSGVLLLSSGNNRYGINIKGETHIKYNNDTTIITIAVNSDHYLIVTVVDNKTVTVELLVDNLSYTETYNFYNQYIGISANEDSVIQINFLSNVLLRHEESEYIIHRNSYITIG